MARRKYVVTRHVGAHEDHNYLGRAAEPGEIFYSWLGTAWGSVDIIAGIALSEIPGEFPFFEFPRDAVSEVPA